MLDSTLIKIFIGEGNSIIGEALDPNTRGVAEVISKFKGSIHIPRFLKRARIVKMVINFSKAIENESVVCLLSLN